MNRRAGSDDGFSLTEAVVASMVLAICAVVTASMLINVLGLTRNTARRTAAANLAASQVELVRQLAATDIPDGQVTTVKTVNGIPYTVVQETGYQTDGSGAASACSATGELRYKKVSVKVTWEGMGSTKPVQTATLRALGFDASSGGLDSTKGAAAVKVADATGQPVSGASVTVKSSGGSTLGTMVTGSDGCAVFVGLPAGSNVYSSATLSGSVNVNGADVVADTGSGIIANGLAKTSLQLAPSSKLAVNYAMPAGSVLPTGDMGLRLTSSLWSGATLDRTPVVCPTGAVCRNGNSFERMFPGQYGVWAGLCADARPASPAYANVPAGGTGIGTVALGAVSVKPSTASVNKAIVAVHANDGTCTAGQTISLGSLPSSTSQTKRFALPPGQWTIKTTTGTGITGTVVANSVSTTLLVP